jgi:hypothetical protein
MIEARSYRPFVNNVRVLLVVLPVAATVLMACALRPFRPADVVAPVRLAVIRGGVAVAAVAVAGVEILSAVRQLHTATITGLWVTVCVAAAVLARWRGARDRAYAQDREPVRSGRPALPTRLRDLARASASRLSRVEKVLLVLLCGMLIAELVLALASYPNNYDSNHYHLTKVEHWVQQQSVELYATTQLPQVILAPGAEYLLLHLRLLVGGDGLYGLVQWGAGIGGLLAVSRIAAQIGAGRLGQLLAAAIFGTAPMVVLQSTSTQTDLTAAAWLACTACFVLDDVRRRAGVVGVLSVGAGAGLTAVTKSTGLLALAPVLLLWGVCQLRVAVTDRSAVGWLRGSARTAAAGAAVVVMALLLVGPFLVRLDRTFGEPLGPSDHREGLAMQRHDPAAVAVNALRIGASTLVVPAPQINTAVATGVKAVARTLGVDPQDREITHANSVYPNPRWRPDEDHSPFPLQSALVLVSLGATVLGRRLPGIARVYGFTVLGVMVMFAAMLKWQIWGNRLVLPALIVGAPLAGWWLARLLAPTPPVARPQRMRRLTSAAVVLVLAFAFAGGYASVLLGWPRRLVGTMSVFVTDPWEQRFARQSHRLPGYLHAADRIRASGAHRIGVFTVTDNWEYPWWLLLPGREFVSLQSAVPGYPAEPISKLDAYVCVGGPLCQTFAPPGWRYESVDGWVGAGYPDPGSSEPAGSGAG